MTAPISQNKRRFLYRNLMFVGLGLLVVLSLASRLSDVPMHIPSTVVMVAIFALSLLQFNTLDETAKQGHYIAWYWGSFVALIVVMCASIALSAGAIPYDLVVNATARWFDVADPQTAFLFGLVVTPGAFFLGFLVWWCAYWLRMR